MRRAGKDKDGDKDKEGRRGRSRGAKSGSNHTPFIVAGAGVLVLVIVAVIVANKEDPAPRAAAQTAQQQAGSTYQQQSSQNEAPRAFVGPASTPKLRTTSQPKGPSVAGVRFEVAVDRRTTGDPRFIRAFCRGCSGEIKQKSDKCSKCGAQLTWKNKVTCDFCAKTLKIELGEGQSKSGFCDMCGGSSKNPKFDPTVRLPFGMSSDASGGRGEECPGCKGSGRCQFCDGTGWMVVPEYFGN
jgi:hypothetical protein